MDSTPALNWQTPFNAQHIAEVQKQYFHQPMNREHSFSEKYDLRKRLFGTEQVIPLWVADMDLPTPPFIIETLSQRLQHPILGYNLMPNQAYQAIIDWQAQHDYVIDKQQICFTHNVANGFHLAIQAATQPGDSVLVMTPVYPPFMSAAEKNGRNTCFFELSKSVNDSLIDCHIDFQALEQQLKTSKIKALLFCHPHNPVGRVWSQNELLKLADLCLKYQVVIISDEIHSDLILTGRHIPLASLSQEIAQNTITLSSPGKTFNLGGLHIGYAVIANPSQRQKFAAASQAASILELNTFALHALIAAYSPAGKNWTLALLAHIENNILKFQQFLKQFAPEVKFIQPQATYLLWVDFSAWGWSKPKLNAWLVKEAKLGLSNGDAFFPASTENTGFMRINLAVSQQTFEQILLQLEHALTHRP